MESKLSDNIAGFTLQLVEEFTRTVNREGIKTKITSH